jgi:formyltetrahydrofolate deformylase
MTHTDRYILTLSCKDVRGIVASVTGFLADNFGFIIESAQYGDESTGIFFLRIEFAIDEGGPTGDVLKDRFDKKVATPFGMDWQINSKANKTRLMVLVSKHGHCLNDILYRYSTGQLAVEIPLIVSNHTEWQHVAKWHNVPFHHLPVNEANKAEQEVMLRKLAAEHNIDLVVLARYMQILSPGLCEAWAGKTINIHHSFLPSFKGARPYEQAFDRGVKLIGATAHYVTTDLDEGPIIEQEVARVDHTHTPEQLTAIGRDIECLVLARAITYYSEHRVLRNGKKTVVFK